MRTTDLSIIIVNYNAERFLVDCVNSIHHTGRKTNQEIIIIDNNSSDGSIRCIEERFPDVRLVKNNENVGFARANNQGIGVARGDFILLLNPDTIVIEDAIHYMLDFARKTPTAGIVGCKVTNPGNRLQWDSCGGFQTPLTLIMRESGLEKIWPRSRLFGRRLISYWHRDSSRTIDWVSGVCMLIRREVIRDIGLLDETFFAYMEDVDFCRRASQQGWKVFFLHDAEIFHQLSATWKDYSEYQLLTSLKSERAYYLKYYSWFGIMLFNVCHILGSYGRLFLNMLIRNRKKSRNHFQMLKWIAKDEL